MDDLDRLFQRLIHNIRTRHPEYLTLPFTIQDLYETLVPYRHYRRELGIDTNQDYEAAIARLLSGERGYIRADPALQEKLRAELASVNPEPGIFREEAGSRISIDPTTLARLGVPGGRRDTETSEPGGRAATPALPQVASAAPDTALVGRPAGEAPAMIPELASIEVPVGCRFCGGTLPEGRKLTFCPHCGMNLASRNCEGCGTELDPDWRYCVNCGKKAG